VRVLTKCCGVEAKRHGFGVEKGVKQVGYYSCPKCGMERTVIVVDDGIY